MNRIYDSETNEYTEAGLRVIERIDRRVVRFLHELLEDGYCPHEVAYYIASSAATEACSVSIRRRLDQRKSVETEEETP